MQQIALTPVDGVDITILVDNVTDALLPDQGPAKRPHLGPHTPMLPVTTMEGGASLDALLAQHGFGALPARPVCGWVSRPRRPRISEKPRTG